MKSIVVVVAAFVVGFGVLQIDKIDPDNYVKLYFGNYLVEIKLLGFILLLVGVVLGLYFTLWLIRLIWRSPKLFGRWRTQMNRQKAEEKLGAGYLSLIKGDWKKAEAQFTTKTKFIDVPYVNFLAAAQAAQEQGKTAQRDDYLKQAYEAAPKEVLAVGMTKAKLYQQAGQYKEALVTLNGLSREGDKNPQFTAMLLQTYESLNDWGNVQSLLPKAKKQQALSVRALDSLSNQFYQNSLLNELDKELAWKSLPKGQKQRIENVIFYVKHLISTGEVAQAEKIISSTLKQIWSDNLVNFYGKLSSSKPAKLLRQVEGWLMARPENAELSLAAGRLAVQAKDIEKAKKYLQQAIQNGQLADAYNELGKIFESENLDSEAMQLYRTGLDQLSKPQAQAVDLSQEGDLNAKSQGIVSNDT